MTKSNSHNLLWFFVSVLPIFSVMLFLLAGGSFSDVSSILSFFSWDSVTDIFNSVIGVAFPGDSFILAPYFSYLIEILFLRIMYEFLVFLPDYLTVLLERIKNK